jgi:hypothetical protein
MRLVGLALEECVANSDNHPPSDYEWLDALGKEQAYLPGGKLPASPWNPEFAQANALQLSDLPPGARPGQALGKGKRPGSSTFDALTYGAILYDLEEGSDTYSLYGVTQRGDQAVLLRHGPFKR